jgi:hypothetical protein
MCFKEAREKFWAPGPPSRIGRSPGSEVDNTAIRVWAQANGIELSKRGRIPADVVNQFKAAGN